MTGERPEPGEGFARAISDRPLARFQLVLVALLLLVLVIDGIDIQLLSLVAPSIISEWNVEPAAFGPALAGALIGMSAGSLLGGALGDRFGRLPVLAMAILLFGAATIIAGMTDNIATMTVLRIISGIGFGAAAPNAMALAADWLPDRARAQVISLMSIGTPAGGMIGASLVIVVLPVWGWRGTFLACGVLTLAIAVLVMLLVRESPSWLAANGRSDQAREVAQRSLGVDWTPPPAPEANAHSIQPRAAGFLTRENARLNVGAGLGFFSIAFVSYALVAWTAIMLTSLGFAIEEALSAVFAFNLAAMSAAVAAGFLMRWMGTRLMLAGSATLMVVCILLLVPVLDGAADGEQSRMATYLLIGGAGGFAGSALASIYGMMASGYAVECRAGGLGFGMMLGRAGGIIASLSGGYLLEWQGSATLPFLMVLAVLAAMGGACSFISDRHVSPGYRSEPLGGETNQA